MIKIGIKRPGGAASRRLLVLTLLLLVTACSSGTSSAPAAPSPRGGEQGRAFPTSAFARISASPVPKAHAEAFQAALNKISSRFGGAGVSATVLSPAGTWSGALGKADGRRAVGIGDQFAIASVTKTLQAAQVMQLVEAGSLRLDEPADKHLPADLGFDSNGATIRQLMGMRSGILDYWPEVKPLAALDRKRVWTTADVLAKVPPERKPAGTIHAYADTNYLLLQHVIEQVTGRTLIRTMRDGGVLDIDGIERLVYQPDERPSAPMSLPDAMSPAEWKKGDGYLPSVASATAYNQFASNSLSLARWWQALCSGELISQDSLTTMATFVDGYGLGLSDVTAPYADSFGHAGSDVGYIAWAGCLPDSGTVIVTLSNTGVEDIALPRPLVLAAESAGTSS